MNETIRKLQNPLNITITNRPRTNSAEQQPQVDDKQHAEQLHSDEVRDTVQRYLRMGLLFLALYTILTITYGNLLAPGVAVVKSLLISGDFFTAQQISTAGVANKIGVFLVPTLATGCTLLGVSYGMWRANNNVVSTEISLDAEEDGAE